MNLESDQTVLLLLKVNDLLQHLKHLLLAVEEDSQNAVACDCAEELPCIVYDWKAVHYAFQ